MRSDKNPEEDKRDSSESSSSSTKSSTQKPWKDSRPGACPDARTPKHPKIYASKAKQVKFFVESTLNKGTKGLMSEFRERKRSLDVVNMREFMVQQETGRNRYKDVGCLDGTRVRISVGQIEYIHANYVSTPKNPKRFICTQAPMQKTCAEFWNMVVQEKSSVILMLCNLYERGVAKCAPYFPQEAGTSLIFADGDVKVVAKTREPFPFVALKTKVKIFVTLMEVTVKGRDPHNCIHYHWMDWPDRGVPEADMAPIQLLNSLKHNDKPIVVHCSAGIGRTGCVVLIQHVLDLLDEKKEVGAMVGYLDDLNSQRHNPVQTEHQYLYVHMVVLLLLKETGYMKVSDKATKRMDAFSKEYQKTCSGFE